MDIRNQQFFTPIELAELLRISKSFAYQLISKGEIRAYRVGDCLRVPREAIGEYMRAHSAVR